MTKQYIWALAIAGAFVAGTILASTMYDNTAFALHQPNHNPPGDDDDMGWKEAVVVLQDQIDNSAFQTYQNDDDVTIDAGSSNLVKVECDPGDIATGGGFSIVNRFVVASSSNAINSLGLAATGSDVPVGWVAIFVNNSPDESTAIGFVICSDVTP